MEEGYHCGRPFGSPAAAWPPQCLDASAEASQTTPRTPRSVEVSVEGQEATVPAGVWASDGFLEARAGDAACTVTVKAGLRGRSGVHVVLRVGLTVEGGEQTRLRFAPDADALSQCSSVRVQGVEECDIGRLPSRSSTTGSPARPPTPGFCQHSWNEDVPSARAGAFSARAVGQCAIDPAQALKLGPTSCAVDFGCGLVLRVGARCVARADGQASLRVEVDGELRLRPRFWLAGREATRRLYAAARGHFCAGNRDMEAVRGCEEALGICEGMVPVPSEMGDVLNLLGALHLRRRTPALAVKCLERALAIRAQRAGPEDTAFAATLSTFGGAQQMLGQHADALKSFQRSVAILERASEAEAGAGAATARSTTARANIDPALASTLHSLGGAQRALGQHAGARNSYERALVVRQRSQGADHPLSAATLNNLGAVLQQLSDDRGAVRIYQKALAIQAKAYGHDHCMTAATLSNLGSAHERVGEHQCAVDCHNRALLTQERWLGREHPGVAATLHNLGNALAGAGRGTEAARCHWRALAVWSKALGPAHPDIAATLHSLGNVYRGLGQPEAAAKCFAGALRIREAALGPTHPETARTRHCAALTDCSLGSGVAALPELETAASSLLSSLGAKHPWSLQAAADVKSLRDLIG